MTHSAFWSRKLGIGLSWQLLHALPAFPPSLAVIAMALLCVGPAGAQQAAPTQQGLQSYDVELLIFRNLSGKETPESWGVESMGDAQGMAIPDEESGATEAPAPAAPTVTFPALPAAKMKLGAIEETMRRSRAYQPLAHIGWTQPGFARNAAKYLSVSSLVPASSGLQGQIALTRGRYLHLTLDLALDSQESAQPYVLRQTRRMRSTERHYIDSPKFGVIAVITPTQ
jgi:hypothetical protein